nr:MAG TPA: hypothetical protein [Caudoviricetes sp.]
MRWQTTPATTATRKDSMNSIVYTPFLYLSRGGNVGYYITHSL